MSRGGGAVAGPPAREVRQVDVDDRGRARVGRKWVDVGFTPADALGAGLAFADRLHRLARAAPGRDMAAADPAGPAPAAVTLDRKTCVECLHDLRVVGRGLRQRLNPAFAAALRLDAGDPEVNLACDAWAPVVWDMLYDPDPAERPGSVDPYRFWGSAGRCRTGSA